MPEPILAAFAQVFSVPPTCNVCHTPLCQPQSQEWFHLPLGLELLATLGIVDVPAIIVICVP